MRRSDEPVPLVRRRPECFDEIAELYALARPSYPAPLTTDLVAMTGLQPTHRVLEIGAGTGQLTVFLAEQGVHLVAIERGPNLARLLAGNLAPFPSAQAVIADFDDWEAGETRFDVVVAATAFHWLDSSTRVAKCARLLRAGGTLALVTTHWGAGACDDRFAHEIQACYARWDPAYDPSYRPPAPDDLPQSCAELEECGLFAGVELRRYFWPRTHSARAYCDLLGTFSNILALDENRRARFLACVFELIEKRFGGSIVRVDVHDLWLARIETDG